MADDATIDVLTAIRSRLIGDASVTAILGTYSGQEKVYDAVPEGVTGAFIRIGDTGYSDSSSSDSAAQDMNVDIHCFDTPANNENIENTTNVRNLMGHVRRLFHDHALSVPGRNRILCRVERGFPVVTDADEIHGVVSLRVLIGHE